MIIKILFNKSKRDITPLFTRFLFCVNKVSAFKILELSETDNFEKIKKKYIELCKKYHPDVSSDLKTIDNFKKINEAYNLLKKQFKSDDSQDSYSIKKSRFNKYDEKITKEDYEVFEKYTKNIDKEEPENNIIENIEWKKNVKEIYFDIFGKNYEEDPNYFYEEENKYLREIYEEELEKLYQKKIEESKFSNSKKKIIEKKEYLGSKITKSTDKMNLKAEQNKFLNK